MEESFFLTNTTRGKLPNLPFKVIKKDILGEKYYLSIAYVNEKTSQKINKLYRNINKPTNILSFLLRKDQGEIILCPRVIKKEAKNFGKTPRLFLGFLVIHGMLHLKGFEHSSRMETAEKKYYEKYFCRDRCRIIHHPGGGRRIFKRRKKS
ncbi:MAG: rRNA maturation RNase YbeY [Candidatus Paceibacterota bacterium]